MTSNAIAPAAVSAEQRYRTAERKLWDHYGLHPTERFLAVGSARSRIRVVEVGDGPPVLFAHGTAGSGPAFGALLDHLRDRRALIMDRPGFGFSSPLLYSAETFGPTTGRLLSDVLDTLGIQRIDVLGHSIGAVFALRLALLYPKRVRRIVLLGGGPVVDAAGVPAAIRVTPSPFRSAHAVGDPAAGANAGDDSRQRPRT